MSYIMHRMKLKQILTAFLLPAFILSLSFSALLAPAPTANALTKKEKQACYDKWAGKYTGTAGSGKGDKLTNKQWNNFKASECYSENKGSCKSNPDSFGTYITCLNVATGEYDNGSPTNDNKDDDDPDGGGTVLEDPADGDGCGGVKTAIIKCDQDNEGSDVEDNGIWGLLLIALNIMTAGVGVLAVGGIVYGAILYTTAEDKADQIKKATDIITNVVIGLVAFALMWAGLNFLVPGGVFS